LHNKQILVTGGEVTYFRKGTGAVSIELLFFVRGGAVSRGQEILPPSHSRTSRRRHILGRVQGPGCHCMAPGVLCYFLSLLGGFPTLPPPHSHHSIGPGWGSGLPIEALSLGKGLSLGFQRVAWAWTWDSNLQEGQISERICGSVSRTWLWDMWLCVGVWPWKAVVLIEDMAPRQDVARGGLGTEVGQGPGEEAALRRTGI
jgi:hypothetical protein